MPNDYFRFKQFTVYQNKSAMKVCTDACLLGAFAVSQIEEENAFKDRKLTALDIGTGTGLLSLILAQKIDAKIDAVEMDDRAADQAKENVAASPWKDRIHVHHTTIENFANAKTACSDHVRYDIIISNPPFFVNALKSDDHQKNKAKHTTTLPFAELAGSINSLLDEDGNAFIMLPPAEMELLEIEMSKLMLYPQQRLLVKQTPLHNFFRVITLFSKNQNDLPLSEEMTIKDIDGQYSTAFTTLLKDYYLYL
jgi:tRNA1Val (adenine37-N6)-methyltransferase